MPLSNKVVNKIVVSGLPGVGKTTICEKISELYQIKHIDIDKQIENRCSRSITNLIREEGELYFRKVESEVLKKAPDDDSLIISVGGGALVDEENFELASKKSTIVQIK